MPNQGNGLCGCCSSMEKPHRLAAAAAAAALPSARASSQHTPELPAVLDFEH